MFVEHDRLVLTDDIADTDLEAGDAGTITHVYPRCRVREKRLAAARSCQVTLR